MAEGVMADRGQFMLPQCGARAGCPDAAAFLALRPVS